MMRVIPIGLIIGPNFVEGASAGSVYRLLNCDIGFQDKDRINAKPPKPLCAVETEETCVAYHGNSDRQLFGSQDREKLRILYNPQTYGF